VSQEGHKDLHKGFTKIPAGEHPGIPKFNIEVPAHEDDVQVSIIGQDSGLEDLYKKPIESPPPPLEAEPILDEDPRYTMIPEHEEPLPPLVDPILELAGKSTPDALQDQIRAEIEAQASIGVFRTTKLANFIREASTDSRALVDEKLRDQIDDWLIDTIKAYGAAKTSILDVGSAITENGAKLYENVEELEKLVNGLVTIRAQKQLIQLFGIDEYESVLILAEIDKTIGRSERLEREYAKTQAKETVRFQQVLDSLASIRESVRELSNLIPSALSTRPSVFLKDNAFTSKRSHIAAQDALSED
jgi:hypothetical protein